MGLPSDFDDNEIDNFNQLERQDLLTGEPRYIEDEIRNTKFALIFGGAAALFALIATILCWILYYRERTRTFLWHAIWLIITLLFAGACAGWGAVAGGAVKTGRQPAPAFTLVVFIGSLFFLGYLLVEAVWLILYHRVHFDFLVELRSNSDLWNKRMKNGSSFLNGWKSSYRLNWWTIFFSVAAAVCFAFTAYAARSVSWNRYVLTRLTLYISLAFLVLSSWLTIYWVEEAYEYRKIIPGEFTGNFLELIKAFSIVAMIFAAFNALVNFVQNKIGYFVFSFLFIVLGFILVCLVGNFFRDIRTGQENDLFQKGECSATLSSIHQDNVDDRFCAYGTKYNTDPGCKTGLVTKWEGNGSDNGYLNPGCCQNAKFFYLYPFMLVGFWTLVSLFCVAIAIGCNLYLADTNDFLASSNKAIGPVDFAGLALVFLALIGFGIYFWARKANSIKSPSNPSAAAYNDPENNKLDNFKIVPAAVKAAAPSEALKTPDWCIPFVYTTSTVGYPTFNTASTTCGDKSKCSLRLALQFPDAVLKYDTPAQGSSLKTGPADVSSYFFPECTLKTNAFYFFYGTEDDIKANLNSLRICPNSKSKSIQGRVFVDQIETSKVVGKGLLAGENAPAFTTTDTESANCAPDTTFPVVPKFQTSPSKNKISFQKQEFLYTMKGRFFYVVDGKYNYDVHDGVVASITAAGRSVASSYKLFEKGVFTFSDVPRDQETTYLSTIRVDDPKNVFLRKEVDVVVNKAVVTTTAGASTGSDEELTAGLIRLDTKDGKVCAATDDVCISKQVQQKGDIVVSTKDGSGEDSSKSPGLQGVTLSLARQQLINGSSFDTATSDKDGVASFKAQAYDAYTVVASKTGFRPNLARVDLQEASNTQALLSMRPTNDAWDMRVTAQINEPDVDFDLMLAVKSDKEECTVSPYNKYCAYSAHVSDVAFGAGQESILVKKLAVANYAAYLQPSPTYDRTCSSGAEYNQNIKNFHYADSTWDWLKAKIAKPLFALDIQTETFTSRQTTASTTSSGALSIDSLSQLVSYASQLLPTPRIVESVTEAKRDKRVLNINGEVAPPNLYQNTYFLRENLTDVNLPEFAGINGTATVKGEKPTTNATVGNCQELVYLKEYTNDTTESKNSFKNKTTINICTNGSNITKMDATNTSVFYNGSSGLTTHNYTFVVNKPGKNETYRSMVGDFKSADGKTTFGTLRLTEKFIVSDTPADDNVTFIDIAETGTGADGYDRAYSQKVDAKVNVGTKVGSGTNKTSLVVKGTKVDNVNNVTDCTITFEAAGNRIDNCTVNQALVFTTSTKAEHKVVGAKYNYLRSVSASEVDLQGTKTETPADPTKEDVVSKVFRTIKRSIVPGQAGEAVDVKNLKTVVTKPSKTVNTDDIIYDQKITKDAKGAVTKTSLVKNSTITRDNSQVDPATATSDPKTPVTQKTVTISRNYAFNDINAAATDNKEYEGALDSIEITNLKLANNIVKASLNSNESETWSKPNGNTFEGKTRILNVETGTSDTESIKTTFKQVYTTELDKAAANKRSILNSTVETKVYPTSDKKSENLDYTIEWSNVTTDTTAQKNHKNSRKVTITDGSVTSNVSIYDNFTDSTAKTEQKVNIDQTFEYTGDAKKTYKHVLKDHTTIAATTKAETRDFSFDLTLDDKNNAAKPFKNTSKVTLKTTTKVPAGTADTYVLTNDTTVLIDATAAADYFQEVRAISVDNSTTIAADGKKTIKSKATDKSTITRKAGDINENTDYLNSSDVTPGSDSVFVTNFVSVKNTSTGAVVKINDLTITNKTGGDGTEVIKKDSFTITTETDGSKTKVYVTDTTTVTWTLSTKTRVEDRVYKQDTTTKFGIAGEATTSKILTGNGKTTYVDGVKQTTARRMLMVKHVKKPHHKAEFKPEGGDFVLISCFNGFGEASLIEINEIKDSKPTPDQCASRISARLPDYTYDKLVQRVNSVSN